MGGEKKRPIHNDAVKQDKEKQGYKVSQGQLLSEVPLMDVKLRLREWKVNVAGHSVTSHSHFQPLVYSFFVCTNVCTDVIAP